MPGSMSDYTRHGSTDLNPWIVMLSYLGPGIAHARKCAKPHAKCVFSEEPLRASLLFHNYSRIELRALNFASFSRNFWALKNCALEIVHWWSGEVARVRAPCGLSNTTYWVIGNKLHIIQKFMSVKFSHHSRVLYRVLIIKEFLWFSRNFRFSWGEGSARTPNRSWAAVSRLIILAAIT